MSRARSFALALAALAGLAASGCDALVQESVARQGVTELKQADASQEGECASCLKFKARPPSGINAPPSMP